MAQKRKNNKLAIENTYLEVTYGHAGVTKKCIDGID